MDFISIKIVNWEKYNPRKDYKKPRWFAMSNTLVEDPDFVEFSPIEFKAFVYILSMASRKTSDEVLIHFKHSERVCGIPKKAMISCIDRVVKLGICTRSERICTDDERDLYSTEQNRTKNNITEHNTAESAEPFADPQSIFPDEFFRPFLGKVPRKVQEAWLSTYKDREWIEHQIKESVLWIHANPSRAPKSAFAKFFTAWLARTWEWKRKNNQGGAKAQSRASLEDLEALS